MSERSASGGYAINRVLIAMCVIIAVNQLGFGALLPVLPLYAQSFGVSVSAIGMTIAVYGLARAVLALPSGQSADRFGRRPTLALGGLMSAIGNAWCAVASDFTEFVIARFVAGGGAGIVLAVGAIVLADIAPSERRGRMMSLYQASFLFAVGIGPLPGGLLAEAFGLAAPFVFCSAASALVALLAWSTIPETRAPRPTDADHRATTTPRFAQQIKLLLHSRSFTLIALVGFMHATVRTGALFNVVPLIGAIALGLSAAQIGIGFALGSVLGLIAAYPAGIVADHAGRKAVIVPATLLTAVAMGGFFIAGNFVEFAAACIVWGVATSISGAAPNAYVADVAPLGQHAAAMSAYRSISDIGYVVGPITIGWLADTIEPRPSVLVCALAIGVIGVVFALWAPETKPR